MKQFMDKDFLLSTPTAQHLFHDYADKMPIVDYHCHINPKESVIRCITGATLNYRDTSAITAC